MRCINVDLETYSDIDLGKCGVYRYAQSLNFEILLFGYSVDGGEVQVVDLACGEKIPQNIIEALTNDKVTKWSFNCSFERICLSVWLQGNYPMHISIATALAKIRSVIIWIRQHGNAP
jgi:DNA polymerase